MLRRNSIQPSGSALMMVLLVVGILSGFILSSLVVINRNTERVFAKSSEMEATALAQKGISLGVHPDLLRNDPVLEDKSSDGLDGYRVSIESEGVRMNINGVLARQDKELLRDLFSEWGVDTGDLDSIVDALVDWVDRNDTEELNGAEADDYTELGYAGRPYNKPFFAVDDMALVLGFEQVVKNKPDWKEYFTVYGDTRMDIHELDKELLAVGAGVTQADAEQFINIVKGEDGEIGTEDDQRFNDLTTAFDQLGVAGDEVTQNLVSQRFQLQSSVKRVESIGFVGNTEKNITLVVRQSNNTPRILYHFESLTNRPVSE